MALTHTDSDCHWPALRHAAVLVPGALPVAVAVYHRPSFIFKFKFTMGTAAASCQWLAT